MDSKSTPPIVGNNNDEQILKDLVQRMRDPTIGIEIKSRKWMFKSYEKVFVGNDAVDWFIKNKEANNRADAITLGNILLKNKFFSHVARDHDFKDEHLFYRFKEDDDKSDDEPDASWADFIPKLFSGSNLDDSETLLQPNIPNHGIPSSDMQRSLITLEVSPLDSHNIKLLDNVHPPKWKDPEPIAGFYNLVVIGAGAGGLVSAAGTAGLGGSVAIIEEHLLGGDCLNYGCVPSKALLRSAHTIAHIRDCQEYGIKINGEVKVDFGAIMERMRRLRASISPNDSARRLKENYNIDVFIGHGSFTSKSTACVNGKTLRFRKAVIATGGRAAIPPIPGLEHSGYLTNESIFNLTVLPRRLAVLGAGAVGCELAQAFARFGSEVYLCYRSQHIMAREDPEAAQIVEEAFRQDKIHLVSNCNFLRIDKEGTEKILVIQRDQNEEKFIVDEILVATGRKPTVSGLGLEMAGVNYDETKGVHVNDNLQTSNPNIYAVGDVATKYKFTHVADNMARLVIRNAMFFGSGKMSSLTIPWATFTDPEVAHVGLYEEDLTNAGIKFMTYKRPFHHVDRAILDGAHHGFVKIHVKEGTDQILGATIVHPHAGDMISEITLAMVAKLGLGFLASVIHPYPTSAEGIRQLGDEFNRTRLTSTVKIFFRKYFAARR